MNDTSRLMRSFMNATAMFVLTFMVIHINNQFLRAFIAMDFELQPTLYFSEVKYFPGLMISSLTQDARIAIVMAVPAISLLLALAGQLIYLLTDFRQAWLGYFFLWWMIHGYNQFFGKFVLSPFMESSHHLITGLLALSFSVKLLLAASAFFLMYKIGDNISNAVLDKTGAFSFAKRKKRIQQLFASLLAPWLLSSAFFWMMAHEESTLFRFQFLTLSVMLLPAVVRTLKASPPETGRQKLSNLIPSTMIVITIIITLGYFWLTKEGYKL